MDKIQKSIILQAFEYGHLLSEWEVDFINDIADRGDNYQLSYKEIKIVNRIGTKIALEKS